MRYVKWPMWFTVFFILFPTGISWAGDVTAQQEKIYTQQSKTETVSLPEITVTASDSEVEVMQTTPLGITFDFENYKKPAPVRSIVDIIKDSALVDYRAKSDIDIRSESGESPLLVRGFDVRRFVNAVDGIPFDQPLSFGQVIDYSQIPLGQVAEIEVIPGSHSARYWGKSIGGVINIKTKKPKYKEKSKPELSVEYDYGSYRTISSKALVEGGYKALNYGFSMQNLSTDGYLRHGAAEVDNYAWSIGYVLPEYGFLKYMGSYTETDLESYAVNEPTGDYDPDYPVVGSESGAGSAAADIKAHMKKQSHRLSYFQSTPLGKLQAGMSYTHEPDHYFTRITKGVFVKNPNSEGEQLAISVQDEIELFGGNTLVMGFDSQDFWTDFEPYGIEKNHLRNNKSGFIEDTWQINSRLFLRGGLRYETVKLSINNYSEIAGWGSVKGYQVTLDPPQKTIERDYNQFLPKFFMTYELDDIQASLRDTSISMGISKIWNVAPFCLGCPGRMATVEPEHGTNLDLILNRRLWKNINCKIDYSYYRIKDYVANNWNYAEYPLYSGKRPDPEDLVLPAGLEGSDMYINLNEVDRQGVELELSGNLLENLSFYLSYAFQELEYDGTEPAGKELGDISKHRVNAGIRWRPFQNTSLMLDYKFQDKQIAHVITETPEGSGNWVAYSNSMDAYHLFDFGIEQRLSNIKFVKDVVLGFYVNNLLDEEYEEARGYPMTERSYTGAVRFRF